MTTSEWFGPLLAHDDLGGWPEGSDQVPGFFDRFSFHLHADAAATPFVMVGSGRYPHAGVGLRWRVVEPFRE